MTERLQQISEWLKARNQPKYRFEQIYVAWYQASGWNKVTVLSKALREELAAEFPWYSFSSIKIFISPKDGTQKAIVTLTDGLKIETVLMPNARGTNTVCVSSQVGCGMACTFCATGTMGLKRNLTADEIVDQVRFWRQQPDARITNIVFMGMGEPLANYDVVKQTILTLIKNCEIGKTRIVLSTVAFPAGLQKLLNDNTFPEVRLAISLHAGTDATRGKIVPSHRQTSIQRIIDTIEQYIEHHANRRHHVTLEYVMLLNVNDTPAEALALAKQFKHLKDNIKVNLIPWNQTNAQLQRSSEEHMQAFQAILKKAGIPVTIRYSKGLDITAACGQLVVDNQKK